uniref:EB domain-containing protein n=1 Tax=Parascaris univalens TaxID=6257 RepID=A0A915AL21_PARUN
VNSRCSVLCPGSGAVPVSMCSPASGCPLGTSCSAILGACCPIASSTSNSIAISCPSGSPPIQQCGYLNECPKGTGCYLGGCCPMSCSGGICAQPVSTCLPQVAKMPVCPNGQVSTVKCIIDQDCGLGMECLSGGCCSMLFCPSGIQAVGRCLLGDQCVNTATCVNGLCCPLPQCSGGALALRVCISSSECGLGFDCNNGGCCPLPSCPGNILASQRCQKGCACPNGQQCINGGCCLLPTCSDGVPAISSCAIGFLCGAGMECNNGGCCPLPLCPSGAKPSGRCQPGSVCPSNQVCDNGLCCPTPVCSNQQLALRLCGIGNSCPIGYVCEGRGCCPEPMPLCPSGGRATQKCVLGSECPPGYGCTPLGGCCLLSLEPACPAQQSAVCQCSPTNACPLHAKCMMGTCCTTAVAAFNQVPGTQCQSSAQCNGYASACARCTQSICVCTNGAASNGATCLQMPRALLQQARSGCDQYGSPCKFVLSTARRKPLFAPIGNITEEPLWFNVMTKRLCLLDTSMAGIDADSTCLPNEKCISGECRMKLWPGEYGCMSDEECSSRCVNTYCERKSDKNVPQCQCSNGMLLYGRCFNECPEGFHESGAYCMHNNEELFWKDANAQNALSKLLNSGSC